MPLCTSSKIVLTVINPGLITAVLRFDIVDLAIGCTLPGSDASLLKRFWIDSNFVDLGLDGGHFFPSDNLHGGPPLTSYFSGIREEVPAPFIVMPTVGYSMGICDASDLSCISFSFSIPTAPAQALSVCELTTLAITLTGVTGSGPGPLTWAIVAGPSHGTLGTLVGAAVTYTPTSGYHGADSFTFKTNDGANDSATGIISITVQEALWWALPNGTKQNACAQPTCTMYPYDILFGGTTYPAGTCMPWTETTSPVADASYCEATDGSWYHGACPIIPQQWRLQQFTIKPRSESTS